MIHTSFTAVLWGKFETLKYFLRWCEAASQLHCVPGGRDLHPGPVPAHGGWRLPDLRLVHRLPAGRVPLAPPQCQPEAGLRLRPGPGDYGHTQNVIQNPADLASLTRLKTNFLKTEVILTDLCPPHNSAHLAFLVCFDKCQVAATFLFLTLIFFYVVPCSSSFIYWWKFYFSFIWLNRKITCRMGSADLVKFLMKTSHEVHLTLAL